PPRKRMPLPQPLRQMCKITHDKFQKVGPVPVRRGPSRGPRAYKAFKNSLRSLQKHAKIAKTCNSLTALSFLCHLCFVISYSPVPRSHAQRPPKPDNLKTFNLKPSLQQLFGDLHRIERSAFQQLIADNPEAQPIL